MEETWKEYSGKKKGNWRMGEKEREKETETES